MKWLIRVGVRGIMVILVGILAVPRPAASLDRGGCWVNGAGYIAIGEQSDTFGGSGMTMKSGSVIGQWQHTTYLGDVFHGEVHYLACEQYSLEPGPGVPEGVHNYANWGGSGRWNGADGYYFDVRAFDRGEPGAGADSYSIAVRDSEGNTVYSVPDDTTIGGGNIQIHPPNGGHPF